MTLEFLPDRFGDAEHAKLDKAVNAAAEILDSYSGEKLLYYLLILIVSESDGELDPKYESPSEAKALIEAHDGLRYLLSLAWKAEHRSYSSIRNLKILASPRALRESWAPAAPGLCSRTLSDPGISLLSLDVHQILSSAFKGEYRGIAVEGFCEYLTENEELFRDSEAGYYAKFCSIVQSSGTGKSRMLTELPKMDVITIYMNIRTEDDKLSFPPRDLIPSTILSYNRGGEVIYTAICYAFFISLFQTLAEYLEMGHSTSNAKATIMCWARQMCDLSEPPKFTTRKNFFQKLEENCAQTLSDLRRIVNEQLKSGGVSSQDLENFEDMGLDGRFFANLFILKKVPGENKPRLTPQPKLGKLLQDSFLKMAVALENIFLDHSTKPKMVIAIDEAHPLTVPIGAHRPADTFCRVVKEWSHYDDKKQAVWVVFASTTSKVADIHNSNRIHIQGEKLFPAYTRLGWDQIALPPTNYGNVENVSEFGHIAAFGRPLWLSLKDGIWFTSQVMTTAEEKLLCSGVYKTNDSHQVVAVLGQRFAVNIASGHPDSVGHLETGVASHLRVYITTTADRPLQFASYPSEPFLSCAAARILHRSAGHLEASLGKLLYLIDDGMIDMGQRGELASRLLWLLAKDLFIRTRKGGISGTPSSWEGHLADCEMIPVVDWFEFIFGPQIWDQNKQAMIARNVFKNAYLNFSHWVCMDTNVGSTSAEDLPLDLWTLRHWQRTSAVQCCHQQPLIDKVIPIYFKGNDKSAKDAMSQILISDKTKESKSSKGVLQGITRKHESIGGGRPGFDSESPPYIAILADLSQTPTFSVTFPEEIDDQCLRICAAGCDTSVYSFLSDSPTLMKRLQELVLKQKTREAKRRYLEYLNAQMNFGSTATAAYMEWEHGSGKPTETL